MVFIFVCLLFMFLMIYGIVFEGLGEDIKLGVVGFVMVIFGGVIMLFF